MIVKIDPRKYWMPMRTLTRDETVVKALANEENSLEEEKRERVRVKRHVSDVARGTYTIGTSYWMRARRSPPDDACGRRAAECTSMVGMQHPRNSSLASER